MLSRAYELNWSHALVCEDDIHILDVQACRDQIDRILSTCNNWQVIVLSGVKFIESKKEKHITVPQCADCIIASNVQQPACYLIHGDYIPILRNELYLGYKRLKSSEKIIANPAMNIKSWVNPFDEEFNFKHYGWDKVMMSTQKEHDHIYQSTFVWLLATPIPIVQWDSYSDITNRISYKWTNGDYRKLTHVDRNIPRNKYNKEYPSPLVEVICYTISKFFMNKF
jgi:hypothetical protein